MVRIVWLVIAIWSVLVVVVETVEWCKWKPEAENLGGRLSLFSFTVLK